MMKKTILLCSLGLLMVGLFSVSSAQAFSFVASTNLNANEFEETAWLNSAISGAHTVVTKDDNLDTWDPTGWQQPLSFSYGEGTYIMLKTGAAGIKYQGKTITTDNLFAFKFEENDYFATYNDLLSAMLTELKTEWAETLSSLNINPNDLDLAWLKDKASHLTVAAPIPAAVWLLGSGLLGLVGVRGWRKRG